MFACLIIRTFWLFFLAGTVFFSHNKSAGTVFQIIFSFRNRDSNVNQKLRDVHRTNPLTARSRRAHQNTTTTTTLLGKHITHTNTSRVLCYTSVHATSLTFAPSLVFPGTRSTRETRADEEAASQSV